MMSLSATLLTHRMMRMRRQVPSSRSRTVIMWLVSYHSLWEHSNSKVSCRMSLARILPRDAAFFSIDELSMSALSPSDASTSRIPRS